MIINGPIESFFKNPKDAPSSSGDSILYHLRRDLEKLYGPEDEFNSNSSLHAMLAMMGMLAGIDYLSRIYSSHHNGSRLKFIEVITDICDIVSDDAEAIYQLRCAIVHSVALSNISSCSYRKGTNYIFNITDELPQLIEQVSDFGSEVKYRVSFFQMKKAFIKIILQLEKIARDVDHRKNSQVINMVGQMHSEKILKAE